MRWIAVAALIAMVGMLGCEVETTVPGKPEQPAVAKKMVELPDGNNTPDGMVVDADGNILLSVLNFNDPTEPAKIMKIDKDDNITELVALPDHPVTEKHAAPLGIDIGSDGNLYIADNQSFYTPDAFNSRILRVVMKDGKAGKVEVVATGFYMANAIACRGDHVYMTESKLDLKASPMPSGVYRFTIAELDAANPVVVKPGGEDPHLVAKLETKNARTRIWSRSSRRRTWTGWAPTAWASPRTARCTSATSATSRSRASPSTTKGRSRSTRSWRRDRGC